MLGWHQNIIFRYLEHHLHHHMISAISFYSNITQIFVSSFLLKGSILLYCRLYMIKKFAEMIYAFVDRISIGQAKNTTLNFTTFSNGHIFQKSEFHRLPFIITHVVSNLLKGLKIAKRSPRKDITEYVNFFLSYKLYLFATRNGVTQSSNKFLHHKLQRNTTR